MAHDYARAFYNGRAWVDCRTGYMQSRNYICERCNNVAIICHHKTYITPSNISNSNITLNWNRLEALCQTCHNQEHHGNGIVAAGLAFDSKGNLIQVAPPINENTF